MSKLSVDSVGLPTIPVIPGSKDKLVQLQGSKPEKVTESVKDVFLTKKDGVKLAEGAKTEQPKLGRFARWKAGIVGLIKAHPYVVAAVVATLAGSAIYGLSGKVSTLPVEPGAKPSDANPGSVGPGVDPQPVGHEYPRDEERLRAEQQVILGRVDTKPSQTTLKNTFDSVNSVMGSMAFSEEHALQLSGNMTFGDVNSEDINSFDQPQVVWGDRTKALLEVAGKALVSDVISPFKRAVESRPWLNRTLAITEVAGKSLVNDGITSAAQKVESGKEFGNKVITEAQHSYQNIKSDLTDASEKGTLWWDPRGIQLPKITARRVEVLIGLAVAFFSVRAGIREQNKALQQRMYDETCRSAVELGMFLQEEARDRELAQERRHSPNPQPQPAPAPIVDSGPVENGVVLPPAQSKNKKSKRFFIHHWRF